MASGHCSGQAPVTSVLLATAIVKIRNSAGSDVSLRALLDSGSQASFITEEMAKAVLLDMQKGQVKISTLRTGQQQKTNGLLSTALNYSVRVNLHVIPHQVLGAGNRAREKTSDSRRAEVRGALHQYNQTH